MTAELVLPPNGRAIGECIYCCIQGDDLSREHAVPYGLNGPWTLNAASCEGCSKITHRFERDTLRNLFPSVRAVFQMQTRRPHERPRTLPLTVESPDELRVVQVPPEDFPLYLPLVEFDSPGIVEGRAPQALPREPVLDFVHLAGPTFEQVAARFPASDFVGARLTFSPEDLARTLAKIGYCVAVFALGIEPFRAAPIRRVIRGEDSDVWRWVGSWTGNEENPPSGLHAAKVRAAGTDIHVILRLFAQFGGREYHIALGPADPAFVESAAWPWR